MKTAPAELVEWLYEELDRRNLAASKASVRAGLSPSAISDIVNGATPGLKVCKALAAFFGVPALYVLELAGHIEKAPAGRNPFGRDWKLREIVELWGALEEEDHDVLLQMARALEAKLRSFEV